MREVARERNVKEATDAGIFNADLVALVQFPARFVMGALMAFRVGQEVVCVDDKGFRFHHGEEHPIKGLKYTIRAIIENQNGLQFEEIVNPPRQYSDAYGEAAFHPRRFRPIVKTDISIFEAMLAPSPKKRVEADA